MKHLNIMGCTVTVTGLHEKELAKLIRKLEPKPLRSFYTTWEPKGMDEIRMMTVRAKNKPEALRIARDIWGSRYAPGPSKDDIFVKTLE